jgi:hypothetical protein
MSVSFFILCSVHIPCQQLLNIAHFPQDSKLLLQEYCVHWRSLVVPNLLRLEFKLVCYESCSMTLFLTIFPNSVFEYTYLLFWNSFWTIAPVIGIGLFDRFAGKLQNLLFFDLHSLCSKMTMF